MNICACLGPKQGEPYCMCKMITLGLKSPKDYEYTEEEKQRLTIALDEIFGNKEVK
jgi:hypothetical protein